MKSKLTKQELLATKMDKLPLDYKVIRKMYYPYLNANGKPLPYKTYEATEWQTLEEHIPTLQEFFELNNTIVPSGRIGLFLKKNSTERALKVDSKSFSALLKMLIKHGFTPADSIILLASKKFYYKWNLVPVEQLKKLSLAQVGGLKLGTTAFSIIAGYILGQKEWWDLKDNSNEQLVESLLSIPVAAILNWSRQTIQSLLEMDHRLSGAEQYRILLSIRKVQVKLKQRGFTTDDGDFFKLPVPKKSYQYPEREKALLRVLDTLLPLARKKLPKKGYNVFELILNYGYTYREAAHHLKISETEVKELFDNSVVTVVSAVEKKNETQTK